MDASTAILYGLIAVALVILVVFKRFQGRERVRRSFDALEFQSPGGMRYGHQMRVVKTVIDRMGSSENGDGVNGAFWYCVGPGPTYFVAIAHPQRALFPINKTYRWVVRPLSAEQMRGALTGDTKATKAAFGDAEVSVPDRAE